MGINRVLQHHDWAYFERAAKVIYGVERIHMSGGEPTFHPQFAEFVPKFKELFGCKELSMVTDGKFLLRHWATVVIHIDEIHFTDYGQPEPLVSGMKYHAWRTSEDPTHLPRVFIFDSGPNMANFTPRSAIGGGKPCHRDWRQSGQVAYADGKLWGCCVAPGIEGAKGVEFVEFRMMGETSEFLQLAIPEPPCERCWFSL